ncbi:MAG: hypothetical protein Q8909_07090, partial [Bacteroidota bacterium]|nr:hypothetical protein [Bacteroidota bacterium]
MKTAKQRKFTRILLPKVSIRLRVLWTILIFCRLQYFHSRKNTTFRAILNKQTAKRLLTNIKYLYAQLSQNNQFTYSTNYQ